MIILSGMQIGMDFRVDAEISLKVEPPDLFTMVGIKFLLCNKHMGLKIPLLLRMI